MNPELQTHELARVTSRKPGGEVLEECLCYSLLGREQAMELLWRKMTSMVDHGYRDFMVRIENVEVLTKTKTK